MGFKKSSSSTLLATPKNNQDPAREETLLVTEAFHLPSTKKDILHQTKIWPRGKKAYFIIAGISMLVLLYLGIVFQHTENDASMHSEKPLNTVRQMTFQEDREDNTVQFVVKNNESGEILSENHIGNETGEEDVSVSEKTDNKDIPGSSLKASYEAKALPKEMNKVLPRHTQTLPPVRRKSTTFSNGFSYGMQNSNRMASPGTAEANLHSFRFSNNHGFSNRTTRRADRRRKRNADVLRFKIKDSGTRSVK